jgi:AmmeMemoRadiSam system protein B
MPRSKSIALALMSVAAFIALWDDVPQRDSAPDVATVIRSASERPDIVETAFSGIGSVGAIPGIRAVLVNHHLLAPHFIARTVAHASTERPLTVIIIAPDHFDRGPTWATTASSRWETPFGKLETDEAVVSALTSSGAAQRPAVIEREHGITNIAMFIAYAMPNARLVPLAIKDGAPEDVVLRLADAIAVIQDEVLVVGSFDFTHESTSSQARENDAISIGVLQRGESGQAQSVAVDSHAGIRMLLAYAERTGTRFTLLARSDSSEVLGQPDRTDVTSYITGYWAP